METPEQGALPPATPEADGIFLMKTITKSSILFIISRFIVIGEKLMHKSSA